MNEPASDSNAPGSGASDRPSLVRKGVLAATLTVAGVAGNYFHIPLFLGLDAIFGSIAVLLAIVWLGARAGLIVAAAAGAYTFLLWGHPFGLLILLAEAAFVGWHRDRFRGRGLHAPPLLISVALFWLLAGVPAVLLATRVGIGMDWPQAMLITLKEPLNGILNAAVAEIALLGVALWRGRPASVPLRQVLFSLFPAALLVPLAFAVTLDKRDLHARLEADLGERLELFGQFVLRDLNDYGFVPELDDGPGHLGAMTRILVATLRRYADLNVRLVHHPEGESRVEHPRVRETGFEGLVLVPGKGRDTQRFSSWQRARYRMEVRQPGLAGGIGVEIDLSAAPLILELQWAVSRLLAVLLVFSAFAILLADWFTRRLLGPLQELAEAADTLPARLVAGDSPAIPAPGLLVETGSLARSVSRMAGQLAEAFQSLARERDVQAYQYAIAQQAMDRLARSETALQEAQAIAHLGSWTLDYGSGNLTWSDETYRLLGYEPGSLRPTLETFFSVVHPDDRDVVQTALETAKHRPDGGYAIEHRVLGADGVPRIVRQVGRVHLSDDGEPLRISGTTLDITAQREVQTALRLQEERYRLVIENLEDLVVRMDADGRFTFVSPSYCELFGVHEDELIGTAFMAPVHPEDQAPTAEAMRSLLSPPYSCRIEHRVRTDQGWRWLQWFDRALRDDEGRILGIVALGRDVTERRQAELELRQREALEHGLLELSAAFLTRSELGMDALIDHALARIGTLTNSDRAYLFGVDADRRVYRNTHEWTAPGVEPVIGMLQAVPWDFTPYSTRLLAAGSPVVIPQVADLPEDHAERAFLEAQGIQSLLLVPVLQGESLTGFVGFDAVNSERDWSSGEIHFLQVFASLMVSAIERERAHADMVAAKERETIGHLASGVAHDFNNLLGVIDANLYYLRKSFNGSGADPEIIQILEETYSALGQAKAVTSGMLSLSRAGLATERVVVAEVIEGLVRILQHILPPEVRLHLEVGPGLLAVSNAGILQAALLNLVLNARDAMPGGGDLTIGSRRQRLAQGDTLTVGELEPGVYVQLSVTDTGCGMGPEALARLFEPLFSTKPQQRGHGLGLFMVHEFVLRSGAGLVVESEVGKGSRFRLLLPSWTEDPAGTPEPEAAPPRGAPATPSPRVLVVDDDPRIRDSVRRLLEIDGMAVEVAEDGAACLERLERDPYFDLVLSDVSMPRLDGTALCQALLDGHPGLPVILMTGQAPSAFPQGPIPGAPTVLRKPLDPQSLRAAIAGLDLRKP
jgi:PAS domain S-box-containing protein